MSGTLGLHLIGDAGHSDENAVAYAQALGGKYATVVNSAKLAQKLMDAGVQVIGRVKKADWNDDDSDNHQSGKEWATYLNLVYPPGAILTAGNELGDGTPERTQAWMLEFVEWAARLNRRVAAYNSPYLNPKEGYWSTQARALAALRANNGIVCFHEGFTPKYRGEAALGKTVGRFLPMMEQYGVEVVVTELCGSAGADFGWKHLYNNDVDAAAEDLALAAAFYAEHGVHATVFSYYPWNNGHGFEFYDNEALKRELIIINEVYPVKENAPVPTTFDLADYIIPNGKPYGLGGVHGSSGYEVVQSRRLANGYAETAKNNTFERIWFDETNIYRGIDTSAIDKDEVYAQFTDGRYGAVWCQRHMKKGDVANRAPDVQHYHADGRLKNADKDIVSQFKLAEHYPTLTFPETGVTVSDVLEMHWLMGGKVIERYWYGKGIGLVGFGAEGITGGYHSRIAQPNETRTPPASKAPAWFTEPLPPPVEKVTPPVPTPAPIPPLVVNVPANPGSGTPVRVNVTGLNLRYDHSTSAKAIRMLAVNEAVTIFKDTTTVLINNYVWVYVQTSKDKGWAALRGAWGESFVAESAPQFKMIMPVGCDVVVSSKFGVARDYDGDGIFDDKHEGIDYAPAHKNCTPLVLAGADGLVLDVSGVGDYGLHIKLKHVVGADTFITWYCHLEKALVKVGDAVKMGDFIGVMGSTGNSTGTHLHLNVQHIGHGLSGYVIADAVDPAAYLINVPQSLSLVA